MKKSELKEIIKTAFLAEADELNEKYDDVKEQEDVDVEDNENIDVDDTENVDVDVEKDIDVDDVSKESDIEVKSEVPGESEDVAAVLGLLTKAQEKAEGMGDEKLLDQIGNTITYYTRAHVVKSGDVAEGVAEEVTEDARTDAEEEGYKDGMKDEKEDLKKEGLNEEVNRFKKLAGLL